MSNKLFDTIRAYCERTPAQLIDLESLVSKATARGRFDIEGISGALAETHRMIGASQCLGYWRLGEKLIAAEEHLRLLEQELFARDEGVGTGLDLYTVRKDLLDAVARAVAEGERLVVANSALISGMLGAEDKNGSVDNEKLDLSGQRILFADDDPSTRALVKTVLQYAGAEDVVLASSGEEALRLLDTCAPTLLISDWNMQPVCGLQLLTRIREKKTSLPADTPVLFLTRHSDLIDVHRAIRGGVNQFLVKPFKPDTLLQAIRNVLSGKAEAALTPPAGAAPRPSRSSSSA